MDRFTKAFLLAALFTESDDNDQPLDRNYGLNDFHPDTVAKLTQDCQRFQRENEIRDDDHTGIRPDGDSVQGYAGHDFWMTRHGHGVGFWDGDWKEPAATKLTEAAKSYPEVNLYVQDGKIHG